MGSEDPPSEKQLNFLKQLGYNGEPPITTSAQASELIGKLKGSTSKKYGGKNQPPVNVDISKIKFEDDQDKASVINAARKLTLKYLVIYGTIKKTVEDNLGHEAPPPFIGMLFNNYLSECKK